MTEWTYTVHTNSIEHIFMTIFSAVKYGISQDFAAVVYQYIEKIL